MNVYGKWLLLTVLFSLPPACMAQHQYWGVAGSDGGLYPNAPTRWGVLYHVDSTALNPEYVFLFDSCCHRRPHALTLAGNGHLYCFGDNNLYEIDPVTDSLRVAINLDSLALPWLRDAITLGFQSILPLLTTASDELIGVGTARPNDADQIDGTSLRIFMYHIDLDTLSLIASIPGFQNMLDWYPRAVNNGLFLLPDGRLMMAQAKDRISIGAIGIADTVTNSYATLLGLQDPVQGYDPYGGWVEYNNAYYSTCFSGATGFVGIEPFQDHGYGTIYKYDPVLNVISAVYAFSADTFGFKPTIHLTDGGNGLFYGQAWGGTNYGGINNYSGLLFSFDPISNTYTPLLRFGDIAPSSGAAYANIAGLLSASNGHLYGSYNNGLFEFEIVSDTLRLRSGLWDGQGNMGSSELIEICRKPNYKPRLTTSFSVCAGSYFVYDLQNVNATSVVWRRNGSIVPSQTNQLLEFAAISEGDEGVWSCTMTNQCGVTEPPVIAITVNPGVPNAPTISGDTVLCGDSSTVVLGGNTNGVWMGPVGDASNGSSSASVGVTHAGSYQVRTEQACGLSFSNIVHVSHVPWPVAPEQFRFINGTEQTGVLYTSDIICPGDSVVLGNNYPGWWYTQTVGHWSTGDTGRTLAVYDEGTYYIVVENACGVDSSSGFTLNYIPQPAPPTVSILFGEDSLLCAGDSLTLVADIGDPFGSVLWWQNGQFFPNNLFGLQLVVHEAGSYQAFISGCGGQIHLSMPVNVVVDSVPSIVQPVILPEDFPIAACDQDSVFLDSQQPGGIWFWTDSIGNEHRDTTDHFLVDWATYGNGSYALYNYNGCGESPNFDFVPVISVPEPEITYTEVLDTVCLSDGPQTLSAGVPAGGSYAGAGVSGTLFDPQLAGIGQHTITYSFNDGACTGYASAEVVVDACAGIEAGLLRLLIVRLSPNPNNGFFTLHVDQPVKIASAQLHNALGQPVGLASSLRSGANPIDRTPLPPGIYSVHCLLDGSTVILDLIVD